MVRYSRQSDLLSLALKMQGSAQGLTIDDIMTEFGVSRRTAERMRDALVEIYPQIESYDEGKRYWRFPTGTLGRMTEPTVREIAAVNRAVSVLRREGDQENASELERLSEKIVASIRGAARSRIATDLEAMLVADGVAFRPGPREVLDQGVLRSLQQAIMAGVMIETDHRSRSASLSSRLTEIGPIAILLGEGRQYLLGYSSYQKAIRLFALQGFTRIKLLDRAFERPERFDLQEWLMGSFGVWREEPYDVEWVFSPAVTHEAQTYCFHPGQSLQFLSDGSLVVRFRAGGLHEMAWHLFRWGRNVRVNEPDALRRLMAQFLEDATFALDASESDVALFHT